MRGEDELGKKVKVIKWSYFRFTSHFMVSCLYNFCINVRKHVRFGCLGDRNSDAASFVSISLQRYANGVLFYLKIRCYSLHTSPNKKSISGQWNYLSIGLKTCRWQWISLEIFYFLPLFNFVLHFINTYYVYNCNVILYT